MARRVAVVGVVGLVLAIAKPWAASRAIPVSAAAPGPAVPAVSAGVITGSPRLAANAPDPSVGVDQIPCSTADWRLVSLDRLADWTVRSWSPAQPAPATGPLDPSIPEVALQSPRVLGVGACRPVEDDAGVRSTSIAAPIALAWRRQGATVQPMPLETLDEPTGSVRDPRVAVLYRPIPASNDPLDMPSAWPAGRFVLEFAPAQTPGRCSVSAPCWIAITLPSR